MTIICKEYFSDIVAVWPLSAGTINYAIPFNVRKRAYSVSDLGVTSIESIIADKDFYSVSADYDNAVEIAERECVVKSTSKKGIAGRSHDVVLSLIINEKSTKSANIADALDSTPHDFLILLGDGSYLLVRVSDNAYKCAIDETYSSMYEMRININMETYNGIIRIV